jgi:hypothetical protein
MRQAKTAAQRVRPQHEEVDCNRLADKDGQFTVHAFREYKVQLMKCWKVNMSRLYFPEKPRRKFNRYKPRPWVQRSISKEIIPIQL